MLKTFPRRATHVSVQPPLSQIRIGAEAWMLRMGVTPADHRRSRPSRRHVADRGDGDQVGFLLGGRCTYGSRWSRRQSARRSAAPSRTRWSCLVLDGDGNRKRTRGVGGAQFHSVTGTTRRREEPNGDVRCSCPSNVGLVLLAGLSGVTYAYEVVGHVAAVRRSRQCPAVGGLLECPLIRRARPSVPVVIIDTKLR